MPMTFDRDSDRHQPSAHYVVCVSRVSARSVVRERERRPDRDAKQLRSLDRNSRVKLEPGMKETLPGARFRATPCSDCDPPHEVRGSADRLLRDRAGGGLDVEERRLRAAAPSSPRLNWSRIASPFVARAMMPCRVAAFLAIASRSVSSCSLISRRAVFAFATTWAMRDLI